MCKCAHSIVYSLKAIGMEHIFAKEWQYAGFLHREVVLLLLFVSLMF